MIEVQREKKENEENLDHLKLPIGSYSIKDVKKEEEFREFVLQAYKAENLNNSVFTLEKRKHWPPQDLVLEILSMIWYKHYQSGSG